MVNIKSLLSLLVGFIMAFLLGIAGHMAVFSIFVRIPGVDSSGIEKYDYSPFGDMTGIIVAIFTGVPLGSSLGIFITKKYILRTGKFSVLCLFTSIVFGFLAARFLWPALYFIGPGLSEIIGFPLVPLFSLIGYNAMAVFLRGRKERHR